MRKSYLVLFAVIAHCSYPIGQRIPLIRTPDGKLFCNVTTGVVSAPNVLMELSYGSFLTVSSSPSREDVHRLTFVTTAGSSFLLDVFVSVTDNRNSGSVLGVERYSRLMGLVGSIAIYKGQGQNGFGMALGASLEDFNESCIPDTLLSIIPIDGTIRASVGLYNGTRMEILENRGYIFGRVSGYVASVPSLVFNRIENSILENGNATKITGYSAFDRVSFSNCSRDIVDHLPSIVIRLRHQVDFFMLLPEDYMEFHESLNLCSIRLLKENRPHVLLWIDLLHINGMNIRFTSDASFDMCDSNTI